MIKKNITHKTQIYWCHLHNNDDWDSYNNLYNLYDELYKNISKVDVKQNLLICPAVSEKLKKTFFIKTPIDCEYNIENNTIKPLSNNYIDTDTPHLPSLKDNFLFVLGMFYIFFAKESIKMTLTSPFFSKCEHTQYGNIVPGSLDISKWFRTINLEFNCYGNHIKFKKGEPLAYFTFDTDKEIEIKRFKMSEKLHKLSETCNTSSRWEQWIPLYDRYKRFLKSKTDKIVLREIQKNLL